VFFLSILARGSLGFFFVRVDLQGELDVFSIGGGFHDAADGGGGEAVSADEQRHVRGGEDEAEAESVRAYLGDAELRLIRVFNQLHGIVLQESTKLIGHGLHGATLLQEGFSRKEKCEDCCMTLRLCGGVIFFSK
jgi:hypothetical protein